MKSNRVTATALLLGLLSLFRPGVATAAEQNIVSAHDVAVIYEIARGFGNAVQETDGDGDPRITGRAEGIKYSIYFYGCTKHVNCEDIQFFAYWTNVKAPLETINAWNAENRFGKAYIDKDGDVCLIHPVNLNLGVTKANLEDAFEWWVAVAKSFRKDVIDKVTAQ